MGLLGETPGGGGGEPRLHGAQWLEGVGLGKVNPQGRPSWGSSHSGKEQEPGLLDEVCGWNGSFLELGTRFTLCASSSCNCSENFNK